MDVAARTLLQRASPERVLSRIFGIVEAGYLGAFGIGSVVAGFLIMEYDVRTTLVVAGVWLPLVAFLAWRRVRAIDAGSVVPLDRLALIRGIPMFSFLPAPTLERLARNLAPVAYATGATIIREGEPGDVFFVVEDGRVAFSIEGRSVGDGEAGPGASFGEIALLRDVPRTATVIALTEVRAYTLAREVFLEAVTGFAPARRAAETLADARLGA